jgi:hypothetical protein
LVVIGLELDTHEEAASLLIVVLLCIQDIPALVDEAPC